jgi:hypothetical protein
MFEESELAKVFGVYEDGKAEGRFLKEALCGDVARR